MIEQVQCTLRQATCTGQTAKMREQREAAKRVYADFKEDHGERHRLEFCDAHRFAACQDCSLQMHYAQMYVWEKKKMRDPRPSQWLREHYGTACTRHQDLEEIT